MIKLRLMSLYVLVQCVIFTKVTPCYLFKCKWSTRAFREFILPLAIHQPVFVLELLILIKSVWCLQKSLFSIYWSVLKQWRYMNTKDKKLFNLNFKMSMLSMVWKCKVYNHFFIMFGCPKTVWWNTTVEIWNCFHMEMFWDVWFCWRWIHRRWLLQQIVCFKISSLIVHYAT